MYNDNPAHSRLPIQNFCQSFPNTINHFSKHHPILLAILPLPKKQTSFPVTIRTHKHPKKVSKKRVAQAPKDSQCRCGSDFRANPVCPQRRSAFYSQLIAARTLTFPAARIQPRNPARESISQWLYAHERELCL